jgi:predicted MFS family arabinose efflux permease
MMEAQAAHAAGDALIAISLAGTLFFSVPTGQARAKVGLYLLLTMTPFAVLSPVIGPMLDRWRGSYRIAIVASAAGRAVLAVWMSTRTDRLWLYPLAFASLVLSRVHGVSRSALVPDVLPEGRSLVSVNSRLSLVSIAGGALAGLPGAGLNAWLGPGATLRFAAVVFAAGAVVATGLPRARATGEPRRRRDPDGTAALLSPRLVAGGVAAAASRAGVGFLVFLLAFVLQQQGEGARGFGAVLAAAGAGGAIGSLLAPAVRAVLREPLMLLASLAAMAVAAFSVAPHFSLKGAIVVALVFGLASSVARLAFDSLVQKDAPEQVRARTFARYETLFQLCWVGGAGLATAIPFGAGFGLRVAALVCLGGIAASVWGARR